MDLKAGTDRFLLIRPRGNLLADFAAVHSAVASVIDAGLINACHDVSEGGILTAIAEMCIASGLGATLPELPANIDPLAELTGAYILSVGRQKIDSVIRQMGNSAILKIIGDASPAARFLAFRYQNDSCDLPVDELTKAWRGTLDW